MKNDYEILTSENVEVGLHVENILNPQWGRWRILSEHNFVKGAWNVSGESGRGNRLAMVGNGWKIIRNW